MTEEVDIYFTLQDNIGRIEEGFILIEKLPKGYFFYKRNS